MNNVRILKRPEVEAVTGLSRSTIYLKMEKNEFPRQIQLSTRSVGWLEHEVQEWLQNRVSETRKGGAQ